MTKEEVLYNVQVRKCDKLTLIEGKTLIRLMGRFIPINRNFEIRAETYDDLYYKFINLSNKHCPIISLKSDITSTSSYQSEKPW